MLTLNACVPQALAERIVASLVPRTPAHGNSPDSSKGTGSTAAAGGAGQDAAAVLQRLHALTAEVLGAAVEPDQPLMEVTV